MSSKEENKRMKLDPRTCFITYNDNTFPVAGYISDYKVTFDYEEKDENGKHILTIRDFAPNYGYSDEYGNIFIFRQEPKKGDTIPWFTVKSTTAMEPKLVFSNHISTEAQKEFNIGKIEGVDTQTIINSAKNVGVIYDKEMMDEMMSAGSAYKPVINENDDFLKMTTKKCLLASDTDANSFKKYAEKSWQISNLIQGLSKETKLSPLFFMEWMGYGGWKFRLRVENDKDCLNPLPYPIEYSSDTNTVIEVGKEEEDNDGTHKGIIAASPHKHND